MTEASPSSAFAIGAHRCPDGDEELSNPIEGHNTSSSTAKGEGGSLSKAGPLVMQIVVRRDLLDAEEWGVGPLMAQVAHATSAILHETRDRHETIEYLKDLKNMRKVVLQLPDEPSLRKLSSLLSSSSPVIPHHIWIEQPEDIPTCVALAPNRREKPIKKALDKAGCRLWKG